MIIQADVCVCDECGHRWLPEASTPKRCASCKSSKWNRGTEEIVATSFNDPVREERKQARRERKAALAQSVVSAVKGNRKAIGDVVSAAFEAMGHKVIDVTPTHTFHSGAKPIAGCDECAAMSRPNLAPIADDVRQAIEKQRGKK